VEQYALMPEYFVSDLKEILARFKPSFIFVRFIGAAGGATVLNENLAGKTLAIAETQTGLEMKIDGQTKYLFEFGRLMPGSKFPWGKQWLIAYHRERPNGRVHFAHGGYPNPLEKYTGPDDKRLPEIKESVLRSVNREHLIEIRFRGKIPIKRSRPFDRNKQVTSYYYRFDQKKPRK